MVETLTDVALLFGSSASAASIVVVAVVAVGGSWRWEIPTRAVIILEYLDCQENLFKNKSLTSTLDNPNKVMLHRIAHQ